jgi:hypothetical protein
MAAKALVLPPAARLVALWDEFQQLSEHGLREGNMVAGEQLWTIVRSPGELSFAIQSTRDPADFVECSLDCESRVLTCRPGPAVVAGALTFQLDEQRSGALCRNGVDYTLSQVLSLILDELVWIED